MGKAALGFVCLPADLDPTLADKLMSLFYPGLGIVDVGLQILYLLLKGA